MNNVRDMSQMLKSMSIHQMDTKEIVKSNFVTLCLAFRGSMFRSQLVSQLIHVLSMVSDSGAI